MKVKEGKQKSEVGGYGNITAPSARLTPLPPPATTTPHNLAGA
jgi:hypothetical protein